MSTDPQVTHPSHYTSHPIISGECWDYAQHLDNGAEFSAFKYFFRHGSKGKALQDVEKGIWYLQQIVDNEHLQPVLNVWAVIDGTDPQHTMSSRRAAALQALRKDIDLEKFARAQRVQQLAVQVCLLIMEGVDHAAALDLAEQVRDLVAKEQQMSSDNKEQQMIYDNKVALRREELGTIPTAKSFTHVDTLHKEEQETNTAEQGTVYPPRTLPHGRVWRKANNISTLHVGNVKVIYQGDNPGNMVGHTPGGWGVRTRAAIDHLIHVLGLIKGVDPKGSHLIIQVHTGYRKAPAVLTYTDKLKQTDGAPVQPYNDVQAALWGIQYAMSVDHEDEKKLDNPHFGEMHMYMLSFE